MTFCVRANPHISGRLERELFLPVNTQITAKAAARRAGWDGKTKLIWLDSDGRPLGGIIPRAE